MLLTQPHRHSSFPASTVVLRCIYQTPRHSSSERRCMIPTTTHTRHAGKARKVLESTVTRTDQIDTKRTGRHVAGILAYIAIGTLHLALGCSLLGEYRSDMICTFCHARSPRLADIVGPLYFISYDTIPPLGVTALPYHHLLNTSQATRPREHNATTRAAVFPASQSTNKTTAIRPSPCTTYQHESSKPDKPPVVRPARDSV